MKKLFAVFAALMIYIGASFTPAQAAEQSPIFGSAKVTTMSKEESSKVAGKGNSTAAYYGYLGGYYASQAQYYGALGNYYNYFSGYNSTSGSYYYSASSNAYYSYLYYYYAYAYS